MTTLWLVRHGPTHQKSMTGWRDVPADLSDRAALARLAGHLPIGPVISSDLIRAVTTADAIQGDRLRLPHDPALREIDFGAWDGLHHTQVSARDPVLSRQFWEQPGDLRAPDGESWNDLTHRVTAAIDALIAVHAPQHLIVVAHMGVIMSQFTRAGGSAYQAMGHSIDPLSVSRMDRGIDGWTLGAVNHRP
ncbi:Broad specificity phosphatase PhoE [Loktanella sp. DSM 29012]|uniref:histidine phosphatase family protein n=1 Tax=Loktanella sp. DSM 29012 TaxID=1881056 RepID=UPI0008D8A28D|nr:histidine phosphatase family protein [Loktanella sp. DSM 29012]SEP75897.1 Broad specificity phosphatase PhoE [Loktanella sp. DSM 29012]